MCGQITDWYIRKRDRIEISQIEYSEKIKMTYFHFENKCENKINLSSS